MKQMAVKVSIVSAERCASETCLRWGKLFIGLFLLWLFIFVLAPILQERVPFMQRLGKYISESGIEAGAIYYTEVDEVSEADLGVRNTLRFYLDREEK